MVGATIGCGGASVPSTLNALALRSLSVIASRVGTFLYPRVGLELERPFALVLVTASDGAGLVAAMVPRLKCSRCSAVSSFAGDGAASPPSLFDPAGEIDRCEESAGDTERVVDGWTAVESAALVFVVSEVDDARASSEVARRGRA